MSAADELCGFGFERYWVNQALELTNHNKDYALEWLLSDEFKLARQQFNEQKRKFKAKQTDQGFARPGTKTKHGDPNHSESKNPLLISHNKDPSLQGMPDKMKMAEEAEANELEIEYNLNTPDLKPKTTLDDFKKIGIDHLLGSSSDDDQEQKPPKNAKQDHEDGDDEDEDEDDQLDDAAFSQLLVPNLDEMERRGSAAIVEDEEDPNANDDDMQQFLLKLKNQVFPQREHGKCAILRGVPPPHRR